MKARAVRLLILFLILSGCEGLEVGNLNDANDLLYILKVADPDITDTAKARMIAVARFVQGLCLR
jgi:hypothetical protein